MGATPYRLFCVWLACDKSFNENCQEKIKDNAELRQSVYEELADDNEGSRSTDISNCLSKAYSGIREHSHQQLHSQNISYNSMVHVLNRGPTATELIVASTPTCIWNECIKH